MSLESKSNNPTRILYLEDSAADAELLREFMKEAIPDAEIILASNKSSFMKHIMEPGFTLILSDYNLPDFNAIEALKARSIHNPGLPFICISGAIGEENAFELYKLGATDYVSKSKLEKVPWVVKRAIEEYRERQESEARYQRLYESMIDAYVAFDDSGKINNFNESFLDLLGYDPETLRNMSNKDITPERWFNKEVSEIQDQIDSRGYSDIYEKEYLKSDHSLLSVEVRTCKIYNSEHKAIGQWSIVRDITERKLADLQILNYQTNLEEIVKVRTEELQIARDSAQAANAAKSIFLANMSHEIRTPMNAVLGFAQLLALDHSLPDSAQKKVSTIIKSGNHLLSIINNVLEMSRIEAGRIEVVNKSFNFHDLLYDLKLMFNEIASNKGIALVLKIEKDFPKYCYSDQSKVRQILINLVGNGVKFTSGGSVTVVASISKKKQIIVEIRDTGIGINPFEKDKVFKAFERTKEGTQKAGGTGLGLSISKQYAELLGGDITLKSELEHGSSFTLELPFVETPNLIDLDRDVKEAIALAPGQGDIQVLVADDQLENRILLREILEPFGFIIREAHDGNEVIKAVSSNQFDLILLDLFLPGLQGDEVTIKLREDPRYANLPIIGISASIFEKEKNRFIRSGINEFLPKPIQINDLLNTIEKVGKIKFELSSEKIEKPREVSFNSVDLDEAPTEWKAKLQKAISAGLISELRALGQEAHTFNPELAMWIIDKTNLFDLESLQKLFSNNN